MFEVSRKKASSKATRENSATGKIRRAGGSSTQPGGGDPARSGEGTVQRQRAEDPVSIGGAAIIRGDFTGKGDLAISGRVEGTVNLPDNDASVEETGYMDGGILARNVNIRGKVQGEIEAGSKVTIFATGVVVGTISAPRIQIEDGAKFKGRIDMEESEPEAATKSNKAPAAAPSKGTAPAKATAPSKTAAS